MTLHDEREGWHNEINCLVWPDEKTFRSPLPSSSPRSSHWFASDDDSVQYLGRNGCQQQEILEIQRARESRRDGGLISVFIRVWCHGNQKPLFEKWSLNRHTIHGTECSDMERPDCVSKTRNGRSAVEISKWTGFGGSRSFLIKRHLEWLEFELQCVTGVLPSRHARSVDAQISGLCFHVRDWKLARQLTNSCAPISVMTSMEIPRSSHEMAAISSLMIPQAMSSRVRSETVDQMLETHPIPISPAVEAHMEPYVLWLYAWVYYDARGVCSRWCGKMGSEYSTLKLLHDRWCLSKSESPPATFRSADRGLLRGDHESGRAYYGCPGRRMHGLHWENPSRQSFGLTMFDETLKRLAWRTNRTLG